MARVTVTDCLDHVDNRFQLVLIATKRARQLILGAEPFVDIENDKPTVLALREIAAGHINASILDQDRLIPGLDFDQNDDSMEAEAAEEPLATANIDQADSAQTDEISDEKQTKEE